jgi:hypothetical protein
MSKQITPVQQTTMLLLSVTLLLAQGCAIETRNGTLSTNPQNIRGMIRETDGSVIPPVGDEWLYEYPRYSP